MFRKKPEVKAVQNKVHQIKQTAKIKQASSYQSQITNTLVKSDNKRKLEALKDDSVEIFIDEQLSSIMKKAKFYCEFCDIQFETSNSLSQHKRSQKHNNNKDMFQIVIEIHDESIQRRHFEAITKNEWLAGSVSYKALINLMNYFKYISILKVICAYLRIMDFPDSLILSSFQVSEVLDKQKSAFLDMVDINELNVIAGPYNINNNHWLAFIIDIIKAQFILLDPFDQPPTIIDRCFQSWCKYYCSRKHKQDLTCQLGKLNIRYKKIKPTVAFLLFILSRTI